MNPRPRRLTGSETAAMLDEADRLHSATLDSEALAVWRPKLITASRLHGLTFPPKQQYIQGLLMEGLGILGGKPKLGKSWWALSAAVAIATGGVAFGNPTRRVKQARVLYLALEDGEARIQDRLSKLIPHGEEWPVGLTVITEWPRLDAGGLDLLAELVDSDGFRVVIVDTLGRVRVPRRGRDSYQEDSDALSTIHDLTRDRPGLAVLLIHHNRKDDTPDDYVDALSGTTGLTGVVDHISVLQRTRGEADAVLRFTSRDAAEHDTAFGFNGSQWTELGDAARYERSKARRDLLTTLETVGGQATLSELAETVKKSKPTVLGLLRGLADKGAVFQDGDRGPWKVANTANNLTPPAQPVSELGELAVFPEGNENRDA